jgi:hypothetical protein
LPSGQRRWIQGPVVQTFAGSTPVPRTKTLLMIAISVSIRFMGSFKF